MMISTKGRYALRFLADVAEHQGSGFVPLKDVAARQEISEKYLEIVVKELVKGGLLDTLRGKGGGYRLNKAPEKYTVTEILELTEESLAPVSCLENDAEPCSRASECRTLGMWKGLDQLIRNYFDNITLADLIR